VAEQLELSVDDLCPRKRPIESVEGLARFGDPETSHDAARRITGRTERAILFFFTNGDGHALTDDELCRWLPDYWPPTLKAARSRLSKKGALVDSGKRRLSDRGFEQIVWRLAGSS
jgi:hypothetical protein